MQHLHRLTTLSALAVLLSLGACTMNDDEPEAPTRRSGASAEAVVYEITTASELSKDQLQAVASFVEGQGGDVQQAKIAAHLDDEQGATLTIELRGAELPGEGLADALRGEFEFLADAQIDLGEVDESELGGPAVEIDPDDDAATIEAKIIADLRAKGVEGEIEVSVTPTQDGHHAIEVEVHEDHD